MEAKMQEGGEKTKQLKPQRPRLQALIRTSVR